MNFIFDVWRSALQLFTVGNRQELIIHGGKPSAAGQAGPGRLTQGHTSPLGLISGGHFIFISQMLLVGKLGRWERPLSLSLSWHSEPLSTWRTVTYDFRPSVWISPLITIMWRRRHLSTVINGAISDWHRMCTTLIGNRTTAWEIPPPRLGPSVMYKHLPQDHITRTQYPQVALRRVAGWTRLVVRHKSARGRQAHTVRACLYTLACTDMLVHACLAHIPRYITQCLQVVLRCKAQ